jgi:integrase
LPTTPESVALYLTALAATHRPATITRRLTAITKAHQANGLVSPVTVSQLAVGETLKGIRRSLGTAQQGKTPLLTADLLQVLAHLPPDLAGTRDRALLLAGYAGAFRRSELAGLDLEHLAWVEEGAVLTLARSKTDQEGQGRQVAIPRGAHAATCPVRALHRWIEQAKITEGPLFRPVDRHGKLRKGRLHPDAVGAIVQRALARAGFEAGKYGGHSLRAGFATQAAKNGATAFDIMRQTGHRSVQTVSRYVREAQLFRDAPASKLGL